MGAEAAVENAEKDGDKAVKKLKALAAKTEAEAADASNAAAAPTNAPAATPEASTTEKLKSEQAKIGTAMDALANAAHMAYPPKPEVAESDEKSKADDEAAEKAQEAKIDKKE